MSAIVKRAASVVRQPRLGFEYSAWLLKRVLQRGNPLHTLFGEVEIGDFANFSEYHSVRDFLTSAEVSLLREVPLKSGVVIDIGANLGLLSVLLAKRNPETIIYAFEPNPSTFRALRQNLIRNRAYNVLPKEAAISDLDGAVAFNADSVNRATASITSDLVPNREYVRCERLDSFVRENKIQEIAFLKIDVEGFESAVLEGARHTVQNVRPAVVMFEVCPILAKQNGFDPREPARTLREAGYKLWRLQKATLRPASVEEVDEVQLENWLAMS